MKGLLLVASAAVALVFGAAALLNAPASAAGGGGDPHKNVVISSDTAKSRIQAILPNAWKGTALTYGGTKDRPGIRVHVFSGGGITGMVDVSDGHVSMLELPVPSPATATVVKSDADAARIATAYLASVGSPTDGLSVEVRDATGSGTPGYTVIFTRMKGDIVLPDYRMVEVDAGTGTVFSFVDVRRPFTDPTAPSIDAASAKASAIRHAGGGSAQAPQLMVSWDESGAQRLVWLVPVGNSDGARGAAVPIDAYSGDYVDLGQ
jgi:hypothetical protein